MNHELFTRRCSIYIQPGQEGQPWRVIGRSGEAELSVSPDGRVKVKVGTAVCVVPVAVAIALQTQEARDFLSDQAVGQFLFAYSDREARVKAARDLAKTETINQRRDYAAQIVGMGLAPMAEAWALARLKFPLPEEPDNKEPGLVFGKYGVARLKE